MYLNICHDDQEGLDRASFVPSEEEWWRRSQLITSCHNLWDWTQSSRDCCLRKSWPAQSGPDLQNPLDLCCFSQPLFFSPVIYIFIRADRSLTSFNFFFFPSRRAAREWAVMCRTVQRVTLAGEKYAEGALWFGSVGINFASAAFTHSLSLSPPLPSSASTLLL